MSFTKFDSDVENITKLPDEPSREEGYTAAIIKALFDKAALDIKNYINTVLIPQLESEAAASLIGSAAIDGMSAENNVHSQLCELKASVDKALSGDLEDGSITTDKLDSDFVSYVTALDNRYTVYKEPGTYYFSVPRSGMYKVTAVGAGAAGSPYGGGMSGACGIKFATLTAGKSIKVVVGKGGTASGECGTDSMFDTLKAQGGLAGSNMPSDFAAVLNADISIKGETSCYQPITDNIQRIWGGDSPYGKGAKFLTDAPGIGAGGWGNGDDYTVGGNGAVIIEYIYI